MPRPLRSDGQERLLDFAFCGPKIQDPSSKIQRRSKHQIPNSCLAIPLGVWSLDLLWSFHPPQFCPPSAVLLRRTGYGGRVELGSWWLLAFSLISREIDRANGDALPENVDLGNM